MQITSSEVHTILYSGPQLWQIDVLFLVFKKPVFAFEELLSLNTVEP